MTEAKKEKNVTPWLVFAGFVLWVGATTVPGMVRDGNLSTEVGTNRKGIECLIQQMAEHRQNNRRAHQADSHHHGYEYHVDSLSIPEEATRIDPDVCNEWLLTPPEATTTHPPLSGDENRSSINDN